MALTRVYHPETNEPFDLPEAKATKLRLEDGWLSQPFVRVEEAKPAVQETVWNPNWRPPADEAETVDRPRGRGRRRAQPAEGTDGES